MSANLILKSNNVFTGCASQPFKGGVAIQGNRIACVGTEEALSAFVTPESEIMEFGEKLIMPAFIDAHTHYFMGAFIASDHVCTDIEKSVSEADCVEMMKKFAQANPQEKRIVGMGWFPANWNDAPLPSKLTLDEAIPDRPVYLICADAHTAWLNSKALEEAGITADMKITGGEIGLFPNGELNGLLFEMGATEHAFAQIMSLSTEEMKEVNRKFISRINANGITAVSDMTADDYTPASRSVYAAVKSMENDGQLTARLHVYTRLAGYDDFSPTLRLQDIYFSDKFRISGVKGFVDGVTSTYTGLLLEPYSDRPDTCGLCAPITPKEELEKSIIAANKAGLPVRLHCIADGSVRMALDMFEASRNANGSHGLKNTIEHIEHIHPDDIPRFAGLDVIASMQPYHLTLDVNEKITRIGAERCRLEWPHKTLLENNAKLAFSTDFPVVGFNPFPNIYAAVTRLDDDGKPTGINPEECISLAEALTAYTAGAAEALDRLEDLGTLEAGKLADIIVVDKNLFAIDPLDIQNCKVDLTLMDGKVVYKR